MEKMTRLFTTGPVDVSEGVLEALALPVVPHYGPLFTSIYRSTQALMQSVLGTAGDVFIMGGPGTLGVDACVGSLVCTDERMFIPVNGFFGHRMVQTAGSYGIDVVAEEFDWGEPIDTERVRQRLDGDHGFKAFGIVHHETSTGMLNPLRELVSIAHSAGLPVCVDAVSSAGGVPINMDDLGIEVLATTSSKCLAAPPGLALVAVSSRGWKAIGEAKSSRHGWLQDLRTWRDYDDRWGDHHPSPTSLPTGLVLALHAALEKIEEVGFEEHMAAIAKSADRVRAGMTRLGFRTMVRGIHASPTITSVLARPEFQLSDLIDYLAHEHRVILAGGIGSLRGKMLRIGHMGEATTTEYTDALLDGVEQFLSQRALV